MSEHDVIELGERAATWLCVENVYLHASALGPMNFVVAHSAVRFHRGRI